MKLFAIVSCLFVLILASGCGRKITSTFQSERSDSAFVQQTESSSDTNLTTTPDSACAEAEIKIVDNKIIDQPRTGRKSKNAEAIIEIKEGKAKAICLCDSVTMQLKKYIKSTYYYKHEAEKGKIIETIRMSYTPTWVCVLAWIGAMVILVAVALAGYHFSASRIVVTHLKNKN